MEALSPTMSTKRAVSVAAEPAVAAVAASGSGVSWTAVLAGAAGAAALSLILLVLGTGLGLSSISPWSNAGATATTIGFSTIAWLTFTQLAASAIGGYLAGRLRTKWATLHGDEVYFRDTAHGFLAWAVATLATAALLTTTVGSVVGTSAQAGAAMAGGATGAAAVASTSRTPSDDTGAGTGPGSMGYFVDTLFRKDAGAGGPSSGAGTAPASDTTSGAPNAEVTRVFANGLRNGMLVPEDAKYVGQVVSQRTGLSQADAEKRVNDTFAKFQAQLKDKENAARDAADKARKAAAGAALWLFVSMLAGAFVASLAATRGGRQRDL